MGHRLRRVNESVREVVSAAIADGVKDPRVGFVTVTGVEASPDLRHAKVFVSVLGNTRERAATLDALQAAHGYLQARVNEALHLKHTPQLEFCYDETTDRAMRIEALMRREAALLGAEPPEDAGVDDEQPLGDEPPRAPGARDTAGGGEEADR